MCNAIEFTRDGATFRMSHRVVSADEARDILEENNYERQRNISREHVAFLKSCMANGEWRPFTVLHMVNGELADGQHRLTAIAETGIGQEFFVLEQTGGAAGDEYAVIDAGKARTTLQRVDALGTFDHIDATRRTAAIAGIRLVYTGFDSRVVRFSGKQMDSFLMQWAEWIEEYDALLRNAQPHTRKVFTAGPYYAAALITLRFCPESAPEFWRGLLQDDRLAATDPRRHLIIKALDANGTLVGGGGLINRLRGRYIASVWRLWLDRKNVQLLRIRPNGPIRFEGTPYREDGLGWIPNDVER